LPLAKGVELMEELRGFIPAGMTPTQFAMRWILDFDAVTTIIPGAKRPEQAIENCSATELPPLPPSLHERLAAFHREKVAGYIRGPQ
jgi:aryl-alcohol dehydrogenase-like predicted oxidoreductase